VDMHAYKYRQSKRKRQYINMPTLCQSKKHSTLLNSLIPQLFRRRLRGTNGGTRMNLKARLGTMAAPSRSLAIHFWPSRSDTAHDLAFDGEQDDCQAGRQALADTRPPYLGG
jgi:hypothetical protein